MIMKRNIIIGLAFILSSCLSEEKNLFQESAALRLNHAIENTKQILISPSNNNGWVMEYFPNNYTEGYTFLMSFNSNAFATIAARNKYTPVYTTDESAFDIIGDNGPVLTFNTYNKVFHLFSDPKDPKGGSELDGIGLLGDYEFIVMNITNDLLTLKGKKRATEIIMYPLAKGQDWKTYFDNLDDLKKELFDNRITLRLNKNDKALFNLLNSTTGIFGKVSVDAEDDTDLENLPFITTDYGIRLSQQLKIDEEIKLQAFKLNGERNKLVAEEDKSYTISSPQPGEFIASSKLTFLAEKPEISGMNDLFERVATGMISSFNVNYELYAIGFGKNDNNPALALRTKNGITAMFNIPMTINGNKVKIEPFDAENITNTEMDNNARVFYERVPVIKELLKFVQGEYMVETSTPFTLRVIKYTKTDGSLMLNVSR